VSSPGFDRTRAGATAAGVAAAALVLAAAVGIVSVVSRGGFFSAPDWQILLTLVAGFLCGACATAAIRLLERRLRDPIGWIAAIVAPVSFAVIAVGIWWLDGWHRHGDLLGKLVSTALVALLSTLVVATLRLVARPPRSRSSSRPSSARSGWTRSRSRRSGRSRPNTVTPEARRAAPADG
jgi:peptidoglycan/LPS O-acetylase OafA/YrhL